MAGIDYARRHLRVGWWSLLAFATLGLALESLHGFKVRAYLDVSSETRRDGPSPTRIGLLPSCISRAHAARRLI